MAIAKTLSQLLDNPIVAAAQDRSVNIDEAITDALSCWQVDLEKRKPAKVYSDGEDGELIYEGTNFDLFTFLMALAQKGAVINLPTYQRARAKSEADNQVVMSATNRHGNVKGITSNAKTHSFSVLIEDYNVMILGDDQKVGAPRNFMVVGDDGEWHHGWDTIEFVPGAKENDWFTKNNLWDGDTVHFNEFVLPSLRSAFYGSRFLATKALCARMKEEASYYRKIEKDLRAQGVTLGGERFESIQRYTDNSGMEKKKVIVLDTELLLPERTGNYPIKGITHTGELVSFDKLPTEFPHTRDALLYAHQRAKDFSYSTGRTLNAAVRAVQLAFFSHGFRGEMQPGNEVNPGWSIPDWQRDVKLKPRARNKYNMLDLGNDVRIAYRLKQITVHVNPEKI